MSAASTSCGDFLLRKRHAIIRISHDMRIDLDRVRSAFAEGWLRAENSYDPRRGASIDTYASRMAEWSLLRECWGQTEDAMTRVSAALDTTDADSADSYASAVRDTDAPDSERDPAEFMQRLAARADAERKAEQVLARLASRPGKRAQQLARVAAIVADGGGREEIIEQLQVEDRRARQLLAEALAAVQGLGVAA